MCVCCSLGIAEPTLCVNVVRTDTDVCFSVIIMMLAFIFLDYSACLSFGRSLSFSPSRCELITWRKKYFFSNIKPEITSSMRYPSVYYRLVYWIFLCLCPAGKSTQSPDVGCKRELKGLLLAVETQEVLGAKRDHLAGGGPTPLPLRQLKELSGYMSLALTGC